MIAEVALKRDPEFAGLLTYSATARAAIETAWSPKRS